MFSAWDFDSWIISIGIVLFVLSLLACLSALISALVFLIWGEGHDDAGIPGTNRTTKEPPIHNAA